MFDVIPNATPPAIEGRQLKIVEGSVVSSASVGDRGFGGMSLRSLSHAGVSWTGDSIGASLTTFAPTSATPLGIDELAAQFSRFEITTMSQLSQLVDRIEQIGSIAYAALTRQTDEVAENLSSSKAEDGLTNLTISLELALNMSPEHRQSMVGLAIETLRSKIPQERAAAAQFIAHAEIPNAQEVLNKALIYERNPSVKAALNSALRTLELAT